MGIGWCATEAVSRPLRDGAAAAKRPTVVGALWRRHASPSTQAAPETIQRGYGTV